MSFRQMVPGLVLALSLISAPAFAAQPEQGHSAPMGGAPAGGGVLSLLPPDAVSDHVLNANGRTIPYTATAGTL
ncbi:MAG: carboxypeptidase, partial [Rhizobium sp.]